MSGWDIDSVPEKDKTHFTKLSVGVTKLRILSKAPQQHFSHWMPQFRRNAICPGRGCPICEMRKQQKANDIPETYSNRKMFGLNVFNYDTNRVEIMEQGITFIKDLRDVMEDVTNPQEEGAVGRPFHEVVIKVKRRGTEKDDTSYRIDLDADRPMTDEEKEVYANQVDLDAYFKPQSPQQILSLLKVTDNFMEAWIEIVLNNEPANETEEAIEIE